MEIYIVPAAIVLIILISIQYSLNKIIVLLKEIKNLLKSNYQKE
ncbi:hypothetical protein [Alkaliphilus pronyensis]|nr:hypothetical protein [Alkaliphilus pronyensis]